MVQGFYSGEREGKHGWTRPSQDWNREGSHRWNTGGGYADSQDQNSKWTMGGFVTSARTGNYSSGGAQWNSEGRESHVTRRGSHAGLGPKGYQRMDERIHEEVCERLTRDPDVDASEIEVTVHNGEVTLTGTVETRQQKRFAETAIDDIPGLRDIHNRIRVQSSQDMTAKH